MALDPEVTPLLEFFEAMGMPEPGSVPVPELREAFKMPPPENPTPVGSVDARSIPGPDGEIPVRIYHPSGDSPHSLLVYFHGGGWVVGDLDSHDEPCRQLCAGSDSVVVSVDYRLAPEVRFPGGLEDCYAATCWAVENAASLGADADRLAVGGDSAGGNLAAAVCLMARDRGGPVIEHQLLIYPVTDDNVDTDSYVANAEGMFLTRAMMQWFWDQYLADPSEGQNPLSAPLKGSLENLPPATVIVAEYDPLRDEGLAYADALSAAGVPVEQREFKGMIHGFIGMTDALTQARVAMDYLSQRLRDSLTG